MCLNERKNITFVDLFVYKVKIHKEHILGGPKDMDDSVPLHNGTGIKLLIIAFVI